MPQKYSSVSMVIVFTAFLVVSILADFAQATTTECNFELPSSRDGSFSPDGKKIVFVSSRNGNSDVFVMNSDGSHPTALVQLPDNEYYPSFSSDGNRITFMSLSADNKRLSIYVADADGRNVKRITSEDGHNGDPSWSPDGKSIAFYSERDGHEQIYVMNADGSNQKRLTNTTSKETTPVFSPDGKTILFISNRDGKAQIYLMKTDGSDQRPVTKGKLDNRVAHWSPDGKNIIFYSRDSSLPANESWVGAEIEIVSWNGTGRRKLTGNNHPDQGPVFSPDGKRILFTSCQTGNREIFMMNSDASELKRLTYSHAP